VAVEKLASEKSAKIKTRQEALQRIYFDHLDIFYLQFLRILRKGSFSTATGIITNYLSVRMRGDMRISRYL
jgi:hypothetical protein